MQAHGQAEVRKHRLQHHIGFSARNHGIVALEQQMDRPACAFAHSDASEDPEGRTGGPDSPWKITSYMGFY